MIRVFMHGVATMCAAIAVFDVYRDEPLMALAACAIGALCLALRPGPA